jgi:hypothetical protein
MENQLEKIENVSSIFLTKDAFEHAQRIAQMFSKSDLVPEQFKGNIGNCVIALEMATRMNASPMAVMQNLYIVKGKPSWSSAFLIATFNASGKFSPLRYEQDEKNGGRVRAWAFDLSNKEKLIGAWVSMDMAKGEGWVDKPGSKWKTMPELMLRYRASSFFVRQFAPEISMGLHTHEEVQDISYTEVRLTEQDKQYNQITAHINNSTTLVQLEQVKDDLMDSYHENIYEEKKLSLKK